MTLPELPAGRYRLDPAHTFAAFSVRHMLVGRVDGRFNEIAGAFGDTPAPDIDVRQDIEALLEQTMRLIDRVMRAAVRAGLARRSTALVETTGRKSGLPRVTPVTNGLDGDVFWIVTEHGHNANYVCNIQANPRIRVNAGGGWRTGIARIVDDDPLARLDTIARLNPRTRVNARTVRATGTELLVIRVDLDDGPAGDGRLPS